MDKHNITEEWTRPQSNDSFLENFTKEMSHKTFEEVLLIHKKLNFLCLEFDPYIQDEISSEVDSLLEDFKLKDYTSDPFGYTNRVLRMLDIVENQTKKRLN